MKKFLLFAIVFMFTLQPISAQEILELDQLTSGELTPDKPTASYFVALKAGQTVHLQAVEVTSGLALQAALYTASSTLVQTIPNPNGEPSLDTVVTTSANGIFRLDISSGSGSSGQYILVLQELEAVEPDEELALDEPISGTLQPNESVAYALSGDANARLIVNITTEEPEDSLDVQLLDADGAVITTLETQETGGELLVPTGREEYQVTLNNLQETAVDYEVTLTSLDGLISTPPPPAATLETVPPPLPTACRVTPLNIAVNVRVGPSTQFATVSSLSPGTTVTAVARNPEGTWYQVDTGTGLGWVALSVISAQGPCTSLQVVFIPTPTFSPVTETPTETPTEAAAPVQCSPREFLQEMDNGAYMTISLPRGNVGDTIFYRDGYHTQYVFPTCRAILWTSLNFTCTHSSGRTFWRMSDNALFDWNATCGSNTNTDQPGLSFGVR